VHRLVFLRRLGTTCLLASSVLGGCGVDRAPEASSDAGADGGASVLGDGGGSCSLEPPPRPTGFASQPTRGSHDYAISQLFLGDTDRAENPSPDAWRSFGYDLDHKLTTLSSTDVCTLTAGAGSQVQVDGDCGTDNSWGANVMPLILQLDSTATMPVSGWDPVGWTEMMYVTGFDDSMGNTTSAVGLTGVLLGGALWPDGPPYPWGPSTVWPVAPDGVNGCTAAGGCPAGVDPVTSARARLPSAFQAEGTFVGGTDVDLTLTLAIGGQQLTISVAGAVVTFDPGGPGSVTNGTLAGVISTQQFIAELQQLAGDISTSLCAGSAFSSIATQIQQTSDIVYDGATISNPPGQPCNAISIGLGFNATEIAAPSVIAPGTPQPPDRCTDGG
jgi:hypothetical protein